MNEDNTKTNIAETLAKEMKGPIGLIDTGNGSHVFALPEGWNAKEFDMEKYAPYPRRPRGMEVVRDTGSFVDRFLVLNSEGSSIWCNQEFTHKFRVEAVLNDNYVGMAGWRDHRLVLEPKFAERWNTWAAADGKVMSQADFAAFLEKNIGDVAPETDPSGADMLQMALTMESVQNVAFKSGVRLQDGSVQLTYIEQNDDKTQNKMEMFYGFTLGIPVLHGGLLYPVKARLRYRIKDGNLFFWYELDHPERVIEAATSEMLLEVASGTGVKIMNGVPN